MQLMSWALGRLGSRFSLLFEPYQRRVLHSALGRFLDEPLDLMVGLVQPDGVERVLPFSTRGTLLYNPEQFERVNSITFRGYSEAWRLRLELNVHAVFYPQDERLCTLPAYYLEVRVNPVPHVRWEQPAGPTPGQVKLFLRLRRPGAELTARPAEARLGAGLDLSYRCGLTPRTGRPDRPPPENPRQVQVRERLVSLNADAVVEPDGSGLTLDLPVTEEGSGTKWRLVWGAHCDDPVLDFDLPGATVGARFRYRRHWKDIDAVMADAVGQRDENLALSRRFEKLFDQAPLDGARAHLIHQAFQQYLTNTFWCDLDAPTGNAAPAPANAPAGSSPAASEPTPDREWFSVWEGSSFYHSTVDVEYNACLFYLCLWPALLARQLRQWPTNTKAHAPSGGCILSHDMGMACRVGRQFYVHDMPVEENANYLLMLQTYTHWTGDLAIATAQADFLQKLALYLIWSDRDSSGFPSEGVANTLDDASPATQVARKQTYLAIKRLAGLQAAADLLRRVGRADLAGRCELTVELDAQRIERQAWLIDHYAVCVDRSGAGVTDPATGQPVPDEVIPGWDAYSIYTANGMLLPLMVGLPCPLDPDRLRLDMANAARETAGRYGYGHTSFEPQNLWVSQNIWRDHLSRYLRAPMGLACQRYWDLQVMSNTAGQTLGYTDTYINNNLSFYPRGIASLGFMCSMPRLVIDRLAAGGNRISVDPDRLYAQRWPLLPLADWKASRVPVCVVDTQGQVRIETQIESVIIRGEPEGKSEVIG